MDFILYSALVHIGIFGLIAWNSWGKGGGDIAMGVLNLISIPFSLGAFYLFTDSNDFFYGVLTGFVIAQGVNYIIYRVLLHIYQKQYVKRMEQRKREKKT